jgi:hypothetical protein
MVAALLGACFDGGWSAFGISFILQLESLGSCELRIPVFLDRISLRSLQLHCSTRQYV